MASSKEYLTFILEQLSDLEGISYRAMMSEYIIYYREKIVGGIYDDRLLVKPVKSAVSLMPNAIYELPYDGAKEMLLVDNVDNKDFLTRLFVAMYDELPAQKKKKSLNRELKNSGGCAILLLREEIAYEEKSTCNYVSCRVNNVDFGVRKKRKTVRNSWPIAV